MTATIISDLRAWMVDNLVADLVDPDGERGELVDPAALAADLEDDRLYAAGRLPISVERSTARA